MLVTLKEYADKVGVDTSRVRRKIYNGDFKSAVKYGNTWMIDSEELYTDKRIKQNKKVEPVFKNRSIQNYAMICIKFAKDTKEWSSLDEYKFYSTDNSVIDWRETSDNAHGGISVDWAFHLNEREIVERAAEEFFNHFIEGVQLAIDDEWDSQSLQNWVNLFNDF